VRARELCHEQFAQSISLAGVAHSVGVHPAHLARMFRRHYQCTVGEYIRRLRLDHAARELTRSDRPVVDIASASGFYDQSHFTHAFKLHTGLTPTGYRSETKKMQR
jgi:AraC family transcriptional regulator